jgi:hypothetical protein
MKTILLFIGLALNFTVNAQWTYQTVNDGFDEPYKIAYTKENNNCILKMENIDGKVYFYLSGGYHCDKYPTIDLVFMVNNQPKRYTIEGFVTEDKKLVFLSEDLYNDTIFQDFKQCSILKIRINESSCTNDIYTFNMSNSTSAFNFMK